MYKINHLKSQIASKDITFIGNMLRVSPVYMHSGRDIHIQCILLHKQAINHRHYTTLVLLHSWLITLQPPYPPKVKISKMSPFKRHYTLPKWILSKISPYKANKSSQSGKCEQDGQQDWNSEIICICIMYLATISILSSITTYVFLVWQTYFFFFIYANNFWNCTHIGIYTKYYSLWSVQWQP